MPHPASIRDLREVQEELDRYARDLRKYCLDIRTEVTIENPNLQRHRIINLMTKLNEASIVWTNALLIGADLENYIIGQKRLVSYVMATEIGGMIAAAEALRDWIHTNFPKHPTDGGWSEYIRNIDGTVVKLTFNFTQLTNTGFFTALDNFTATIS